MFRFASRINVMPLFVMVHDLYLNWIWHDCWRFVRRQRCDDFAGHCKFFVAFQAHRFRPLRETHKPEITTRRSCACVVSHLVDLVQQALELHHHLNSTFSLLYPSLPPSFPHLYLHPRSRLNAAAWHRLSTTGAPPDAENSNPCRPWSASTTGVSIARRASKCVWVNTRARGASGPPSLAPNRWTLVQADGGDLSAFFAVPAVKCAVRWRLPTCNCLVSIEAGVRAKPRFI